MAQSTESLEAYLYFVPVNQVNLGFTWEGVGEERDGPEDAGDANVPFCTPSLVRARLSRQCDACVQTPSVVHHQQKLLH